MAVNPLVEIRERLERLVQVQLNPNLERLSASERRMLPLLIEAADAMEAPFWIQNYGESEPLLASVSEDETRRYLRLNYGPWDSWHGDEPILAGAGEKPAGANFYPVDMRREEFESEAALRPELRSPFSMVRREEGGGLASIPYHEFFREHVRAAADKIRQAAGDANSPEFQAYLSLRADALETDDFRASDLAWMELRDNTLDLMIGPMEIVDRLFGIKTAYSALILVKDRESGARLSKYLSLLPRFQEALPVPAEYRRDLPGLEADLQVYDLLHAAGLDGAEPPRGVAWPDDEEIQREKGFRALLLENVMRAKFEAILMPLAALLIHPEQRRFVRHQALFDFILFHELAHGLGVKFTLSDRRPVREALSDLQHAVEEGKADLMGHQIAIHLHGWGMMEETDLIAVFVSSLLNLLYNYEGRQSISRLNYFKERGAYSRDHRTGTYRVHLDCMREAVESLLEKLLRLQGDGDYEGALEFFERYGRPDYDLEEDIERIESARLPLGIVQERSGR
jgi:hypothetical protein